MKQFIRKYIGEYHHTTTHIGEVAEFINAIGRPEIVTYYNKDNQKIAQSGIIRSKIYPDVSIRIYEYKSKKMYEWSSHQGISYAIALMEEKYHG